LSVNFFSGFTTQVVNARVCVISRCVRHFALVYVWI